MHATQFVESYLAAWNHHDPQAVADHISDKGIYYDVPEKLALTHDELIDMLRGFFSEYRHRYELIGEILTGNNTVAYQYREIPDSRTTDSASSDAIRGAEFMTLRGDAVMTIADYYEVPGASRPANLEELTPRKTQRPKYAKSGLADEQLLDLKVRLETVMRGQQVYLQPDLTLPKLAQRVGCSPNHLSQVINSGFGMSFFDYLNQYRVDHAKQFLTQAAGHRGAILNVAFKVGFNSNSAFYCAFKKLVGQTPAQYRRKQLNRSA